jgi:peptidoglycan/xylan/chitin deacetylase (PgdA/CDA1 family)
VPAAADRLGIPRTLLPEAEGVALTFDDGPHPEGTPAVLELLAGAGARAMFFLIGEQVERRPSLAAEIAAAGHGIGVHGYRHILQLRRGARALREDVVQATTTIGEATGVAPSYHRAPYGVYSPAGLAAAREAGLRPLLWSRWGKDWRKFTTPRRIASRVLREIEPRDVILLHDADFYSSQNSHRRTGEALKIILRELNARELDTVLPV